MHVLDPRVVLDKARRLSVGAVFVLIGDCVLDLVKHRVLSWANDKLDEEAVPILRFAAMLLRFAAEHPIQTAFFIIAGYCAGVIVWAHVATLRTAHSKKKTTYYQPLAASMTLHEGHLEVHHYKTPGLLPALRRFRHRLRGIFSRN